MNKAALFHSWLCVGFDMWRKRFYVNERNKKEEIRENKVRSEVIQTPHLSALSQNENMIKLNSSVYNCLKCAVIGWVGCSGVGVLSIQSSQCQSSLLKLFIPISTSLWSSLSLLSSLSCLLSCLHSCLLSCVFSLVFSLSCIFSLFLLSSLSLVHTLSWSTENC